MTVLNASIETPMRPIHADSLKAALRFLVGVLVLLCLAVVAISSEALAQTEDEDGVSIATEPARPTGVKTKRRAYPGGRDEEDLQVQSDIAQPTRNPDIAVGAPAVQAEDAAHD